MANPRDSEKRRWILTAWSSLFAVLTMALLFFSIYETRDARPHVTGPAPATERTGERMLY